MAHRLRQNSKRRFVPYDLSVPANWTVAKLKTEISKFGVTLSASSIPKSALLQIHQQLETVQNRHGGNQLNQPTSSSCTSQMDNTSQNATLNIEPDNSVSDLPSPETSISIPATSQIGSLMSSHNPDFWTVLSVWFQVCRELFPPFNLQ